ncbi:MAG: hypothetical protein ACKO34_03275 [Vampirovibrionales bacterium]
MTSVSSFQPAAPQLKNTQLKEALDVIKKDKAGQVHVYEAADGQGNDKIKIVEDASKTNGAQFVQEQQGDGIVIYVDSSKASGGVEGEKGKAIMAAGLASEILGASMKLKLMAQGEDANKLAQTADYQVLRRLVALGIVGRAYGDNEEVKQAISNAQGGLGDQLKETFSNGSIKYEDKSNRIADTLEGMGFVGLNNNGNYWHKKLNPFDSLEDAGFKGKTDNSTSETSTETKAETKAKKPEAEEVAPRSESTDNKATRNVSNTDKTDSTEAPKKKSSWQTLLPMLLMALMMQQNQQPKTASAPTPPYVQQPAFPTWPPTTGSAYPTGFASSLPPSPYAGYNGVGQSVFPPLPTAPSLPANPATGVPFPNANTPWMTASSTPLPIAVPGSTEAALLASGVAPASRLIYT